MTVQQGHYPNEAKRLHVTDSTEVIAVWIIENTYTCWPAKWAAKDHHGDYPITRKAKDENGDDVTLEASRICCVFLCNLYLFLIHYTISNELFGPFDICLGRI